MTQVSPEATQNAQDSFELTVQAVDTVAEGILALTLGHEEGTPLPCWEPGAHIDLVLDNGLIRQYSLSSDPLDRSHWRLGILREPESRGGSAYIHDHLTPGTRLGVRGPRNNFPLVDAENYLFIAGGIGITPLLPMIARVESSIADWTLLYGGRTMTSMAFRDELAGYGRKVILRPQDEHGLLDIDGFLASTSGPTAVYCCGPETLIAAVETACEAHEHIDLHVERFAPKDTVDSALNTAFEVECTSSGITLQVPTDKSILEVAREAGIEIMSSCSEGTCGTCETDVIDGTPDHRDSILTPAEREANESIMVCVSRCHGKKLVLDL
ncbi:oxidoreductase (plasmid) [Rhodococcus rhodochrous]|uniref:PDR/VanB family oxidoreductase n=1 Tax=Rhodococcus rhodochrous TaxID=1829 RepID=UPI00132ED445|nr:PDR/VanB family oxidoreductase [Rhodococcus rhodochrous]QHG85618.1 oxidoreductase [Rhodococcus rhodochrous]